MQPQLTQASDDVCDDDYGLLGSIPDVDQPEETWCWVASSKVFTDRFGYSSPSNQPYQLCELYNLVKGTSCCGLEHPIDLDSHSECKQDGWPYEVFELLTPIIDSRGIAQAMSWELVKAQICPKGHPARPFIYIDRIITGDFQVRHTNVIKGYQENQRGKQVYTDTHNEYSTAKWVDYDCIYRNPRACGKNFDHYADFIDIRKVVPPPEPPPLPPVQPPIVR